MALIACTLHWTSLRGFVNHLTPPPPPPPPQWDHFSLFNAPLGPRSLTTQRGRGAIYQFPREPFDLKHVSTSSAIRGLPPGNPLFLWIIPVIVKSGRIDNGKLGIFFLGEGERKKKKKKACAIYCRTNDIRYNEKVVEGYWLKFTLSIKLNLNLKEKYISFDKFCSGRIWRWFVDLRSLEDRD